MNTPSPAQARKRSFDLLKPRAVTLLTLGVLLLCAVSHGTLDRSLALLLDRTIDTPAENFWNDITKIGNAVPYLTACLLLYIAGRLGLVLTAPEAIARRYYAASRIGLLGLVSYAVSGALVHAIKYSLGRMRPTLLFKDGLYGFSPFHGGWATSSFPSGHTQSIFVIATLLALLFPRMKWLFFSIAFSVGLSRLMVQAHYLSDVLFGAYIAVMSVLLVREYLFPDVKAVNQSSATLENST